MQVPLWERVSAKSNNLPSPNIPLHHPTGRNLKREAGD